MCGLVGVFNKRRNGFLTKQQEVFSTLLFVDFLRGPDSTGVFLVSNNGDMSLIKEASHSIDFMRTKEYDGILQKAWSRGSCLIGHNRKATRGSVNDANAHPFVVDDNIVLVHNGTMFGDHKKIADVEVDSHAIAHAIHNGESVEKALSSFDAAFALIWYDVKNESVNLIRNKERPLFWMETEDAWYWSSEKCMLEFAASRHDLTLLGDINDLPENTLQTYTLKGNTWDVSDQPLKLTKPVYQAPKNHSAWPQHGQAWQEHNHRRHPYANAYSEWEDFENDVPFKGTPPALPAPAPANTTITEGGGTYSVGDPPGTTGYFERQLAIKTNRFITLDEWKEDVIRKYPSEKKVIAQTFEYTYANQKDTSGGFYLYAYVVEDPDILIRFWLSDKNDEERIIQMAGSEYVYELTVRTKKWASHRAGAVVGRTPGFVIMTAGDKITLKWGNGIGDSAYAPKKEMQH
jgi:hypothetical protein